MDRIIAPYGYGQPGIPHRQPAELSHAVPAAPAKSARDYFSALRRRWWMAFALALTLASLGTVYVLKQPAVYQAQVQIRIHPPEFNAALSGILGQPATHSSTNLDSYVTETIGMFGNKMQLASVVREFEPSDPVAAARLVSEIANSLVVKRLPGSSTFLITIELQDQERIANIANAMVSRFKDEAFAKERKVIEESKTHARRSIDQLRAELSAYEKQIGELVAGSPYFSPDGENFAEAEYLEMRSIMSQKRGHIEDLAYEQNLASVWPSLRGQFGETNSDQGKLGELLKSRHQLENEYEHYEHSVKNPRSDPYLKEIRTRIGKIDTAIERVERAQPRPKFADLGTERLNHELEEMHELEAMLSKKRQLMQETAPQYQTLLGLRRAREQIELLITETQKNELRFESIAPTMAAPVVPVLDAVEPTGPVRPRRVLLISGVIVLSLLLGLGLVLGLEAMDRMVKVPEHLSAGLSLPLLGVVPRIRRVARINRGGHLWTPAAPGTLEADAFRSIRASLIGAEPLDATHSTILITSAKAGEGKSTTALNLAATCALSGERTILVDCDLRRPTLAAAFGVDPEVGLVDVLTGEMPWQRAVAASEDVPGLSFLPAGLLGDAPIEILGSLELKQLLTALARQFHRVILDGPAILGLADGRVLGRLADTTILVVRAGANEISPLCRAKAMLDQSRIAIGGVVFNDLSEDIHNWSSYGSNSYNQRALSPVESRRQAAAEIEAAPAAAGSV